MRFAVVLFLFILGKLMFLLTLQTFNNVRSPVVSGQEDTDEEETPPKGLIAGRDDDTDDEDETDGDVAKEDHKGEAMN